MEGGEENPENIEEILTERASPTRRLRSEDRGRLQLALTTVEYNFAELEEFVDGELREDAYFIVENESDEAIQTDALEIYRLTHNYLSGVYSFNEAIRATITNYLPRDMELTKENFDPRNSASEYMRRLMFIRGLRIAAQHGAFNDVLPVQQWDNTTSRYRLSFDDSEFCDSETIDGGSEYFNHTSETRTKRPLEYIGSFHETNLQPFYKDCISWLEQR